MTLAGRLRRKLDRPLAEHERWVATVLLAVVLAAASAALVLTRPASLATRSRDHSSSLQMTTQAPKASAAALPQAGTRAVDGFLVGYLRYLYGRGPASGVENATAAFTRSLEQHPPRVPPGLRALHPRVLRLVAAPAPAGELAVTAIVTDGDVVDYGISLLVTGSGGAWRVSGLDTGS
jgi:hypothetical protein